MPEKFDFSKMENWQKWRDEKAEELKTIPDHKERRENLNEVKEKDELYKITGFIKKIKTELPEDFAEIQKFYKASYESIENSEDWDIEDVSDKIPEEYKILTEYQATQEILESPQEYVSYRVGIPFAYEEFLDYNKDNPAVIPSEQLKIERETKREKYIKDNEDRIRPYVLRQEKIENLQNECGVLSAINKIEEKLGLRADYENKEDHPIHKLINLITHGEYLDCRNLNHVVMAQIMPHHKMQSFRVDSPIEMHNDFFMESGVNVYVRNLYKPLMIMTPFSEGGREFIRESMGDIVKHCDKQLADPSFRKNEFAVDRKGELLANVSSLSFGKVFTEQHIFNELFFLANYPFVTPDKENGKAFNYSEASYQKNKFKWQDMFNIIVDLKIGKVFRKKINEQVARDIKIDIEYYRKILKEKFDIDFFDEEIKNDSKAMR